MVSLVAESTGTQANGRADKIPQKSPNGASSIRRMTCPRCSSQLRINYYEPECLRCGYVDYSVPPTSSTNGSLLSSGTGYVLRYVGQFSSLADTLTHVKLERVRNRVVYGVRCPFCTRPMSQTSLSGKRREIREERYKCVEGHRVSLAPGKNGALGWK